MSFCQVRDVGGAATIGIVKAVAAVLDIAGIEFYSPSHSWIVEAPRSYMHDIGVQSVDTGLQLVNLTAAERVRAGAATSVPVRSIYHRHARLAMTAPIGNMRFTAETGVVSKLPLAAGIALFAGDTIIRGADILLIEADADSEDGDIQLIAPEVLRLCAISVGRRIMRLEVDQAADWDDSPRGVNSLIDGWMPVLAKYSRGAD